MMEQTHTTQIQVKLSLKNQFILLLALSMVVGIAIIAHAIGGPISFAVGYGFLALITWKVSQYFQKENLFTKGLTYLFLVMASSCMTLFFLA